eukprot:558574-Prorocentrum_minimum.AAC.1
MGFRALYLLPVPSPSPGPCNLQVQSASPDPLAWAATQVNKIQGYLQGRIVSFLLNISYTRRRLYFCRHGETMDNVRGVL